MCSSMKALRRTLTSPSPISSSSSPPPSLSPPSAVSSSSPSPWIHLRSVLFVVASSSPANCSSSDRGSPKSPWSNRKRKRALSAQKWKSLFTPDGKLRDGGVKFLKKVRSGGVDPNIRAEVWPFLLGVYDLNSTKEERDLLRTQKRKEYEKLRRQCQRLLERRDETFSDCLIEDFDSSGSEDAVSARESLSSEERCPDVDYLDEPESSVLETESSDSESSDDPVMMIPASPEEDDSGTPSKQCTTEDFATWQRIIRLDALRVSPEWIPFSLSASSVSGDRARRAADSVGLKDYDHLEPCRILHAARLVAILEAYALHDPETGYCQGMADLLSPIITVLADNPNHNHNHNHDSFWCFVGFMRKARDNFRLDEAGIRRQLGTVSKIIRYKDSRLYRHLQKLQAEDCFFVYRMVVVLFRRELTFEQTVSLWEVMWADQAAIRAGIGKGAGRSMIRPKAPPTDDLLLYAIAALVLQRRRRIIDKYSSMDEILRECNDMSGQQLDVWKLLDDAHNLVVNLHDKIERATTL